MTDSREILNSGTSSARGLVQFIKSTWQTNSESRGIDYGFDLEQKEKRNG